jgi:hypothetical protein
VCFVVFWSVLTRMTANLCTSQRTNISTPFDGANFKCLLFNWVTNIQNLMVWVAPLLWHCEYGYNSPAGRLATQLALPSAACSLLYHWSATDRLAVWHRSFCRASRSFCDDVSVTSFAGLRESWTVIGGQCDRHGIRCSPTDSTSLVSGDAIDSRN